MVKKLKTKFFKLKPSFFISIAFLILGGYFVVPHTANAAITPNSLNITLSNSNPSIGQNITAIVSVKQEELAKVSNKANSTFSAIVWNTTTDSVKNLTSIVSVGTTLGGNNPLVISIKNPQFISGKNHLKFSMVYSSVSGIQNVVEDFQSEIDINVSSALTTGPATLNLSNSISYSSSNTRTAKVDINFNAGGSGRQATSFDYDCGNGKTGSVSATTFNCDYAVEAKDYVVKVSAKDASGVIVSVPSYTVSVTNNDVSGSVNRGEKDGPNPVLALITEIIGIIIGFFQELVYGLFYWLIAPLIQAMLSIHVYTDTFVAVIYPGWEVIRNICNIFFIVALMVIALATLFRVDSYKTRPLLVQLILAALMINFSLVIAQAILALADTIQAQFLPANVTVIRSLAGDLMVGSYRDLYGTRAFSDATFAGIIKPLFFLAMSMGSFMVFAAIAVFLVIRIVALWLLLLISPIAYACGVLPSTAQYRKTWWDNFLKYAFFTPIMAFFLNLTAVISNQFKDIPILQTVADPTLVKELGNSDLAGFVFKVASNILLLIFLIAALKVADIAGVYGASGITSIAQKGIFAPFAGAGFLGKAAGGLAKKRYDKATEGLASGKILPKLLGDKGGQWLSRQAFKVLHPVATVGAIREEGKEERELYKGRVAAGAVKVARKQYGWRRTTEDPTYLFDEHKGKELYEKEEGHWSPNEQINVAKINRLAEEAKNGDLRASIKLKFALAEAFRNRNLNEVMGGANGLAARHPELFGGKLNYNSDNIRFFFQQMTKGGYLDEDFTREFLKDLGTDAYEKGDFNGAELVYSDLNTGHAHMIKMGPRGSDGNALPVGWEDYVKKRQQFINEAYTEAKQSAPAVARANMVKKATVMANAEFNGQATQAQIDAKIAQLDSQGELEKAESAEMQRILSDKENTEASKNHGHNDYANSMHAERGRNYMKVNLSKKKGAQQLDMFHDSIININVETGEAEVSDAGTQILGKLDEQGIFALLRDNMSPKTKDKFKIYAEGILKDSDKGLQRIENDVTKIVKDEYREKGIFLSPDKESKEVRARTDLWLAAAAGLASGQQGQFIMQSFNQKKDKDGNLLPGEDNADTRLKRVRNDFINMIKVNEKV